MKKLLGKVTAFICAAGMMMGTGTAAFAEEYTVTAVQTLQTLQTLQTADKAVYTDMPAGGAILPEFSAMTEEDAAIAERDMENIRKSLEYSPMAVGTDPFFEFDYTNDYFYKQLKTDAEKDFYKECYDSCMEFLHSSADVEKYSVAVSTDTRKVSIERANSIFGMFVASNPQFFFCGNRYEGQLYGSRYEICVVCGNDLKKGSKRSEIKNYIKNKTSQLLTQINSKNAPLPKISEIADIIVNNVVYDNEGAKNVLATFEYNQTIAGSIYKGTSVCNGYSMMFVYLCHLAGINDCIHINATNHAYNAVKIDDQWYLVDTTWMDRGSYDKDMNYFMKSYDTFKRNDPDGNHVIDEQIYKDFPLPDLSEDYEFPKGDVNSDGVYDDADDKLIGDIMAGYNAYLYNGVSQLDLNGDNIFDMKDVVMLKGMPSGSAAAGLPVDVYIKFSKSSVYSDETFDIEIGLNNDTALTSFGMFVTYDSDVFEIVSDDIQTTKIFGSNFNYANSDIKIQFQGSPKIYTAHHFVAYSAAGADKAAAKSGKVCTIRFRVKDGAADGSAHEFLFGQIQKEVLGKYCAEPDWVLNANITPSVTAIKQEAYSGKPAKTPIAASVEEDSITLKSLGSEYEYTCSSEVLDDDSAKNAVWVQDTVFDGLKPNKTYYFYSRIKATKKIKASPISKPPLTVKTSKAAIENAVTEIIIPDEVFPGDVIDPTITYTGKYTEEDMGKPTFTWNGKVSGNTYTVSEDDVGKTLSLRVTFENCDGYCTAETEVHVYVIEFDPENGFDERDVLAMKQKLAETDILPSDSYDLNSDGYFDIRDLSALIYIIEH